MKKDMKIAVLIDADNVTYKNVSGMLAEIAKFGTPTTKRIYGDWTSERNKGWKTVLLENAITPIQQYSYTTGKNATDSAMIIDAMDILYSQKVDGFCLISSDSDFTKLAIRLRESSMTVYGIGEEKTPEAFRVACDRFIFIENIEGFKEKIENIKNNSTKTVAHKKVDARMIEVISSSIEDIGDDEGWAFLGDVGNLIVRKRPDFDPRNYGFYKLTPLIKSLSKLIEIDERKLDGKRISHVFVRLK